MSVTPHAAGLASVPTDRGDQIWPKILQRGGGKGFLSSWRSGRALSVISTRKKKKKDQHTSVSGLAGLRASCSLSVFNGGKIHTGTRISFHWLALLIPSLQKHKTNTTDACVSNILCVVWRMTQCNVGIVTRRFAACLLTYLFTPSEFPRRGFVGALLVFILVVLLIIWV